jgi:glycosyltransferase involved in cell wall biosynthesis
MQNTLQTYHSGKVSIIIPVYNRELLLPETLDSILAQTYINWECILVDDGSTDDTWGVCQSYVEKDTRFKLYARPHNLRKGANACRNHGFRQSLGEFIQWFDSDDIMAENLLESSTLKFRSSADLIVVKSKLFENNLVAAQDVNLTQSQVSKYIIHKILEGTELFLTSQVVIKRTFLISSVQFFDERLQRNQETDFFIRLLLKNAVVDKNFNSFVFIRGHINSISGFYTNATDIQKLKINYPAYLKIYLNCKRNHVLNYELKEIFNDFFYRCLRKSAVEGFDYFNLYFLGLINSWFPSRRLATKIFLNRLITLSIRL